LAFFWRFVVSGVLSYQLRVGGGCSNGVACTNEAACARARNVLLALDCALPSQLLPCIQEHVEAEAVEVSFYILPPHIVQNGSKIGTEALTRDDDNRTGEEGIIEDLSESLDREGNIAYAAGAPVIRRNVVFGLGELLYCTCVRTHGLSGCSGALDEHDVDDDSGGGSGGVDRYDDAVAHEETLPTTMSMMATVGMRRAAIVVVARPWMGEGKQVARHLLGASCQRQLGSADVVRDTKFRGTRNHCSRRVHVPRPKRPQRP
jgi:hypothetical protein